jgi:predicted GNAT family acetyltransferase
MEPRVADDPAASRFQLLVEGEVARFADYQRRGTTISFTHTVIDSKFKGRAIATTPARGALDAARDDGSAVLPFCPFIRRYIRTCSQRSERVGLNHALRRTPPAH